MQQSYPIGSKDLKAAKMVQAWIKGRKQFKIYQKIKKRARYRKNVINEIVQTERGFNTDISIIVDKVRQPILEQKILSEAEVETLFINIEDIRKFNHHYLSCLESGFNGVTLYNPYKTVFKESTSLIINPNEIAFQHYFKYCNGFTQAVKIQEHLGPKFKEFLATLNRANTLKGMDLPSFLVKPVQRLPKYILLYKDLLKNTDEDHPDYIHIKEQLKYFSIINEENNKNMDSFMNRLQIEEICTNLKIEKKLLLDDPNRMFKFSEKLLIIKEQEEHSISVHALTDALVIADNDGLIKIMKLDSMSFTKDQSDTKYISNLYQIVGVGDTLQCCADTIQQKKKSITQFEQLIQQLREIERKNEEAISGKPALIRYPVPVIVVGTEERNSQSFQKHTVYITQLTIGKVSLKIFLRYSEVVGLSHKYMQKYPDIPFPAFPHDKWLTNHKTRVIEERKIAIEGFLQTALQSPKIVKDKEILEDLRLPQNFYELPQKLKDHENHIFHQFPNDTKTLDGLKDLQKRGINIEKLYLSAGEILKGVQIDKQQTKVNVSTIVQSTVKLWDQSLLTDPTIHKVGVILPNGQKTEIAIDDSARALEIVSFVAGVNKLTYCLDFRLYLIDQLNKQRVIDDDEIVYKVIADERRNNDGGVLNKIEQFLSKSTDEIQICLKKYIYLSNPLEQYDYFSDEYRLEQLTYSVFEGIYNQKYQYNFTDYCLFAALYYHVKYPEKMDPQLINQLQLDKIKKVIPKQYYTTIQDKEWRKETMALIKEIDNKLNQIKLKNEESIRMKKVSRFPLQVDKPKLAMQSTMNSMSLNSLSTMALYFVQTYQKTLKWMKGQGLEIYPNIYLGISLNSLSFLNPQRKEEFKSFEYKRIKSIKSYPSQIIFEFDNYQQLIRLDTYQSYEIKLLIEEYQHIHRFTMEYKIGVK